MYGNVTPYGSSHTIRLLIRDSNGAVVWGGGTVSGTTYIIFDPKYADFFQVVAFNPTAGTETVVLNWRVCPVPS